MKAPVKDNEEADTHNALLLEHEKILKKLGKWRSEAIAY